MKAMRDRAMPPRVAAAFARFPAPVQTQLGRVRSMIFEIADECPLVGPLTETLKWGEPAYLTEATGSGTTIRLGWLKASPERAAVFFNCNTTLVPTFREMFAREFTFSGDRALLLTLNKPVQQHPLSLCLRMALNYHGGKPLSR